MYILTDHGENKQKTIPMFEEHQIKLDVEEEMRLFVKHRPHHRRVAQWHPHHAAWFCCGPDCQDPLSPLSVLHAGTSRLAFASCICNNVDEPVAWMLEFLGAWLQSCLKTQNYGRWTGWRVFTRITASGSETKFPFSEDESDPNTHERTRGGICS